jgi:hypothetical protein
MATTQTTKRRTAATKRSTTAKKAAATRAQNAAATNAGRAKTNVKRRARQPTSRPIIAQAEFVGAVARNAVQTGVTAGSKAAAAVTKRVAGLI